MGFKKGQRYALRLGDRIESAAPLGEGMTEKDRPRGRIAELVSGKTAIVEWDGGQRQIVYWDARRCEGDIRRARE